ncbi:YceD family protein [Candidatus Paracaedibacter symbiosus]|uniref:YceD family protein n=1 Tax=Candidatus Paracaedibacter symbiosus TaxID=244582 RepID=UPI000689A887|nr:DUF177 domain-containing protein [Candidatus Paracaedibacter symbiosus]
MMMDFVPEFSRFFALDKGHSGVVHFRAKADETELEALAKRFDLRGMKNLVVEFTIKPHGREVGAYDLTGVGQVDVIQVCVISSKDVPAHVDFSFHTKLMEGVEQPIDESDLSFLEEETDIDYYQNGQVDLGEIAAQYLSLSLDPYPRSPDAGELNEKVEENVSEKVSPFAVLHKLK